MQGLTNVKTVNGGRCEREVHIPVKAVIDPEEGTTKHTKATKEREGEM
jgi:hypothetical protein